MKQPIILRVFQFILLSALLNSASLSHAQSVQIEPGKKKRKPDEICLGVLQSNCEAKQSELLRELLSDLYTYSLKKSAQKFSDEGRPPALVGLPKDRFGQVNWTKSITDGRINPVGALEGEEKNEGYEGFLDNLILIQVNAHFMADVVFPHGIHTYWLNCESCHPKPFKKEIGANNVDMNQIFNGESCGKCHGRVAFHTSPYSNCRRCHSISKSILGKRGG